MFDLKSLDHLGPVADEMLGGLHADEAMHSRIRYAAVKGGERRKQAAVRRFAPAVCCAALALVCVGVVSGRSRLADTQGAGMTPDGEPAAVMIETIAAGDAAVMDDAVMMADLGDGARVRMAAPQNETLFASAGKDMALVMVDGDAYRMLKTPQDIGASLLGKEIGSVSVFTEEPSLASSQQKKDGLSNVAEEGGAIYAISGMDASCAVAAKVDGKMRVFQRVSYAGRGPGGESLEDTFSVRGKVKEATLSGVGTLTGKAANDVINVLLDHAVLRSADASARKQSLTVTLDNGLRLQLGVSGDTLCGCGGWSCPEFFEAFQAAL